MGMPDTTVTVPISVDDVTGVAGGLVILRFHPALLHAQSVQSGALLSGFNFVSNVVDNEVRISFANSMGLASGSGPIAEIIFAINAQTANEHRSELTLFQAEFYDETTRAFDVTLISGQIEIGNEHEFELFMPAGISTIHIPLDVTRVNDQPRAIRTVGDFYDALGPDRRMSTS